MRREEPGLLRRQACIPVEPEARPPYGAICGCGHQTSARGSWSRLSSPLLPLAEESPLWHVCHLSVMATGLTSRHLIRQTLDTSTSLTGHSNNRCPFSVVIIFCWANARVHFFSKTGRKKKKKVAGVVYKPTVLYRAMQLPAHLLHGRSPVMAPGAPSYCQPSQGQGKRAPKHEGHTGWS